MRMLLLVTTMSLFFTFAVLSFTLVTGQGDKNTFRDWWVSLAASGACTALTALIL